MEDTILTIEEIANAVNQQGLYVKTSGSQITPWNVALRAASRVSKSADPVFDVLIKLRR